MHKFKFGGIDKDGIYLDETVLRMAQTHRRMFVQVASQLIKEGKNEKALKALDYAQQVIPSKNVAHDYVMSSSKEMAEDYIALGEYAKAETILDELANRAVEYITWYMSMDDDRLALSYENCLRNFYILDEINKSFDRIAEKKQGQAEGEMSASSEMADHYAQKFEELYDMFNVRIGRK
jgi:tetratricopeptide (TPR) repeat protein